MSLSCARKIWVRILTHQTSTDSYLQMRETFWSIETKHTMITNNLPVDMTTRGFIFVSWKWLLCCVMLWAGTIEHSEVQVLRDAMCSLSLIFIALCQTIRVLLKRIQTNQKVWELTDTSGRTAILAMTAIPLTDSTWTGILSTDGDPLGLLVLMNSSCWSFAGVYSPQRGTTIPMQWSAALLLLVFFATLPAPLVFSLSLVLRQITGTVLNINILT